MNISVPNMKIASLELKIKHLVILFHMALCIHHLFSATNLQVYQEYLPLCCILTFSPSILSFTNFIYMCSRSISCDKRFPRSFLILFNFPVTAKLNSDNSLQKFSSTVTGQQLFLLLCLLSLQLDNLFCFCSYVLWNHSLQSHIPIGFRNCFGLSKPSIISPPSPIKSLVVIRLIPLNLHQFFNIFNLIQFLFYLLEQFLQYCCICIHIIQEIL